MTECCICSALCDGSLMRTDLRYHRVRDVLLSDEVPRTRMRAGIKLCHSCQRDVYFCGGFNQLLTKVLKNEARLATIKYGIQKHPKFTRSVTLRGPNPKLGNIGNTKFFGLISSRTKFALRREARKVIASSPPQEKI